MAGKESYEYLPEAPTIGLRRELGTLGLVAAAVCTVIGGGINVLSVEVQGKVPGVGSMVPLAFILGVTPALFTALAYAVLASAMPRAGGGYVYVSRGLDPFLGFMATTSKWFGLATCVGVIAWLDVPLLRDALRLWDFDRAADVLDTSFGTLWLPLLMVWLFWLINLFGMRTFGTTVIILMFLMLAGGVVLITTGLLHTPADFAAAMAAGDSPVDVNRVVQDSGATSHGLRSLLPATGFLFFAYIGFATISQAGGEARNPAKTLPRAFLLSTLIIAGYYVVYSAAVYHAVPWQYVEHAVTTSKTGVSAPGLIGVLMPPLLAGFVALTAAVALANDIPPMLMAVSRLFFSWAKDGIFPKGLAAINRTFHTPHWALTICAVVASGVIIECYVHGKEGFFAGIDMVTIALLFTYLLIAVSVLAFPRHNPELYAKVSFIKNRTAQIAIAIISIVTIGALLCIQVGSDVSTLFDHASQKLNEGVNPVIAWVTSLYRSATVLWFAVMGIAAVIFTGICRARADAGEDVTTAFRTLPHEGEEEPPAPGFDMAE